eukprot:CCRYP_000160-RC/>CCRYP_000160-RC protein AED:0.34 eAED:0.34 QI:230/1/1/1/0.33/0.28/7/1541/69
MDHPYNTNISSLRPSHQISSLYPLVWYCTIPVKYCDEIAIVLTHIHTIHTYDLLMISNSHPGDICSHFI